MNADSTKMKEMDDIEFVERYLGNQLDLDEQELFRRRMQNEQHFRKLVEDMDLLLQGVRRSGERSTEEEKLMMLKNTIGRLEEEVADEERKARGKHIRFDFRKYALPMAAALVLLTVAAIWLIRVAKPMTNEAIFQAYMTPYENTLYSPKRGGVDLDDREYRAFTAYDNENYGEAARLFEELLKTQDNQGWQFYLGVAYLADGQTQQAVRVLQKIGEESIMKTQRDWYLALAYIREGKRQDAQTLLERIAGSTNKRAADARAILNELN